MTGSFTVSSMRPIREGMTVSRSAGIRGVTWFSLGADTDISRESYDVPTLYLCAEGRSEFLLGEGAQSPEGVIYTEIIAEKEINMNNAIQAGEALKLANLIAYEEGSVTNMDVVHNDKMKFVLMAFDKGTGLSAHRAPGNAIITVLEGKAIIGYEGKDHPLSAGESFRFDKNGLHSVTADGQFKMALLLVLE